MRRIRSRTFRNRTRNGLRVSAHPRRFVTRLAAVRRMTAGQLGCILLLLSGCHQAAYQASKLPRPYLAPVVHSAQHLDLSQLSHASSRNEVVYPGDVVNVSIATGLETRGSSNWTLRVDDRGVVNVPLVGDVEIGGMELTAAEAAIHEAGIEREIYRNPQVSLAVQKRRSNSVTVLGAVQREGTYELASNQSDLLSALVAAGGLAKDADTLIEIRTPAAPSPATFAAGEESPAAHDADKPGRVTLASLGDDDPPPLAPPAEAPVQSLRIDLASTDLKNARHDLQDGGVVMVMRRPKQTVQVIGLVKKPGQFEVPVDQELRLLDAIAMAGGLTTEMADKVIVVRSLPHGRDSIMIRASLDTAKREHLENIRLAAGDVVSIEETALTFTMTELQKYIRFTVSAASRLTLF